METSINKLRISIKRNYKKEPNRDSGAEKYYNQNKFTRGAKQCI